MEEARKNKQELIKEFEEIGIYKLNIFSTEIKTIPTETAIELIKQLDEPEPLPFKLKDVVRRIRGFDSTTQTRWLNDILKELGDDYGSMKYRSGYEQGKLEGEWVGNQLKDADKIRRELNQVKVPQVVADWYEENKDDFEGNLFRYIINISSIFDGAKLNEFDRWFLNASTKPFQTLVNMHQFGYDVEEEKKFFVKIKCLSEEYKYLNYFKSCREWLFSEKEETKEYRTAHTRKELEEAGFGWVFDCEGVEIEEVEG